MMSMQELLQCIQLEQKREIRKKARSASRAPAPPTAPARPTAPAPPRQACEVVGQLGINLLSADQNSWPELLPFMLNATRGTAEMHEAALLIFGTFSDFISVKMQPCAEIAPRSRRDRARDVAEMSPRPRPRCATPPRPRLISRP